MGNHEGTLQNEHDEISMKTKLILTRFGSTIGTIGFDEKSFFKTLSGFSLFWDYKLTIARHVEIDYHFICFNDWKIWTVLITISITLKR